MIQFAHHTSVSDQIFTWDCSIFSHNISLSEILGHATYRTWWQHIDPFCPTCSWFPYSSLFPLQQLSSTPVQTVSLTSMLAVSLCKHLVRHSHPAAQDFLVPWCNCQAWYQVCCLPPSCHRLRLDFPSHDSSPANVRWQKCILVHRPHHFRLDGSRFFQFGGHLLLEFVLHGGTLQTNLVAAVICLPI